MQKENSNAILMVLTEVPKFPQRPTCLRRDGLAIRAVVRVGQGVCAIMVRHLRVEVAVLSV